jgi:conjugal transfer mating pair stabilization protein TraG
MIEIFTVGGGEYIVNVLNAVASWTGAGGYKSLIQVTMVMGLALAVIVLAFNQDWRAWLNWFLGATLIRGISHVLERMPISAGIAAKAS